MQSVQRAAEILRIVGSCGPNGARLTDVTARAGLGKSTTFRLLAALVQSGLLDQDPRSKLYFLGIEMLALGAVAANRHGLAEIILPSMERLASYSNDTVFLSVRQGLESICIARVIGSFPIKTLALDVGDRRPLGIGAGSLALLSALPEAEVKTIVEDLATEYRGYAGHSSASVLEMVERSKQLGYSLNNEGLVKGMSAVGVHLPGSDGIPLAAISIAAISSRLESQRVSDLVAVIQEEIVSLKKQLTLASGGLTAANFRQFNVIAGTQR
jgi:DNA-binding IclR family transcriptional regulator